MELNLFTDNLKKYADAFSPSELMDKIGNVGKKAGLSSVYAALVLYHSMTDPNLPTKDKLMIAAALGYFIMPVDIVPDFVPGGLVDDGAVLTFAVRSIWNNINPTAHDKSKAQLKKWFGEFSDSDIVLRK